MFLNKKAKQVFKPQPSFPSIKMEKTNEVETVEVSKKKEKKSSITKTESSLTKEENKEVING